MDTQQDLFKLPGRRRVTRKAAEVKRDVGIERSGERADRTNREWSIQAAELIREFADEQARGPEPEFLVEDAAIYAHTRCLPLPPDGRAWGAAIRLARSRGYVVSCGFRRALSSNLSPKVLWRKA